MIHRLNTCGLKQEIKSPGLASPCRHASPLKAKHSLTDLLLGMTPDKSSMICFRRITFWTDASLAAETLLLSFEHPVFFAAIRAETPVKSVRLVDYIAARLRELGCCAEVLPGGHFFFEHQCNPEKKGADKDLLTALNTFLKEADPDASIEILESKRSAAASDDSRLSFWRTAAALLDDEVKATHPDGEVTLSDLIILAEACLNDFKAFYLDFQPIISCSDGSYIGGEFLIRLDSDKINFGPDKFIPLFSESNFMPVLIEKYF